MGDRIIEAAAEGASKQLLMSISAVNKEEYCVSIWKTGIYTFIRTVWVFSLSRFLVSQTPAGLPTAIKA